MSSLSVDILRHRTASAVIRLIASTIFFLVVVEKGFVDDAVTARGRVIPGKIPVTRVIWQRFVQIFNVLVDDINIDRIA